MLGLMLLGVFAIYLMVSVFVTKKAVSWAKANGKRPWLWGGLAAFVMYNLVFWDWIPTVVAHKYYCSTQAGFTVYKTPEQWEQENPGVMETLVANKGAPSERQGDMTNHIDTYFLNQRFNWVVKRYNTPLFNRWRHEQEVTDAKTNEVLARYVDFTTSQDSAGAGWVGWKFWLYSGFIGSKYCSGGSKSKDELRNFRNNFMGVEK